MKAVVIVPKGQNVNSRGCKPTEKRENVFDPCGVAPLFALKPWVKTHGYSSRAASRPSLSGGSL